MTRHPGRPTHHDADPFGDALHEAGSCGAGAIEFAAIERARARGLAVSVLRRGLVGLEAMVASAGHGAAAALRAVRHAAPAALLCLAAASIPARAEQQAPAIMLLPLGEGAHGVLSVPMHHDTRGLPGVVVVHDERGRESRAGLYVDTLLAQGVTVLEIEPFPRVTNGVVALPHLSDLSAAALVTLAAEALASAEGIDPRAIGALGFGAGARAVLLAAPAAEGRVSLSARVLLYPGCETLRRPFFARFLPGAAPGGPVLLLHGGRDARSTQASCAALAGDLARLEGVRQQVVPEAGHAWDDLASDDAALAASAGAGTGATAVAADAVSVFLAEALRTTPVRAAAR